MLLEHVATAEDLMLEVIGGNLRPEGAGPVQQTIVGIAVPGKLPEASAGTIDSTALWMKHGALSTVAMLGITGPLGQLGLGASYESMAHYQDVRAAIRSDAEFGPLFARNAETFSPGSFSLGLWSLISRSTPN